MIVSILSGIWFYSRLTHPSLYIFYMTVDMTILSKSGNLGNGLLKITFLCTDLIMIVGYTDRSLFCSSQNLIESLQTSTAFCIVTGKHIQLLLIPYKCNFIMCVQG